MKAAIATYSFRELTLKKEKLKEESTAEGTCCEDGRG